MIKKIYLIIFINILALPLYSQNKEENCDYARKKYLEENPDVLRAGLDPWMHYTVYGKNEKRKWHSCAISQSPISYNNNNPSVNVKSKFDKFDDFQTYYNSVNSSNIEFKGTINSNPPNPSESIYKTDYYNGKLIYEGYYKEVIKSNYGNVVHKEMIKHGAGKTYMTNSDGFLEGFYFNNKLNGYGTHRSPSSGYTYKGNFVNDHKHGFGVVIYDGLNGTTKYIYEGNFNNNNYEGSGTIIYNFMSFVGAFENGKIKNGIAYYPRNEKYIGGFLNGNFNGNAEYYFSDGSKFIGGFSGGKFHSFGVLYYPDGSKKGGIWQQGNLLHNMAKYSENPVVYEYNSEYPYTSFVDGVMEVNRNSQKGVINPDGLEIVPCKYSILSYESNKIIGQIILNGTMQDNMDVYDRKGNFIGNLSYSKELEKNRLERQRIAENARPIESNNQTINRNLKNEDCSVIVKEYEAFVNEFSNYSSDVKTGKRIPNITEYSNWDKKIRYMNDIIYNCSDGMYNQRIMTSMLRLQSSAKIIFNNSPNTSYSTNKNSINKPKNTSVRPENNSQNSSKREKEKEDLDNSAGHEVVKQSANCKYCGNTIFVQRNVPISPRIRSTFNETGGIAGTCNKCSKTTTFTYQISKGKFIKLDRID